MARRYSSGVRSANGEKIVAIAQLTQIRSGRSGPRPWRRRARRRRHRPRRPAGRARRRPPAPPPAPPPRAPRRRAPAARYWPAPAEGARRGAPDTAGRAGDDDCFGPALASAIHVKGGPASSSSRRIFLSVPCWQTDLTPIVPGAASCPGRSDALRTGAAPPAFPGQRHTMRKGRAGCRDGLRPEDGGCSAARH